VPLKAISVGIVGVVVAVLSVSTAAAQDDARLPQGPNRELVVRTCGSCHDLSNLFSTVGRTRERWNLTIEDMTRFGMRITRQERGLILDYLATYLPRQ
jgi:hypothetical protein